MPSQEKIDANRANARKSTGPRTDAGKAASRNNAYRHGMCARTVLMPGEDAEAYNRLLYLIRRDFPGATEQEDFLIRQMADAQWRLQRLKGIELGLYEAEDIDSAELDRVSRWQVRMENSYYKAYKMLLSLKKEAQAPPRKGAKEPARDVRLWHHIPSTGETNLIAGPPLRPGEKPPTDVP